MRLTLLLVPIAVAAAFVIGRATSPAPAAASPAGRIYTGRANDVFRVPAVAMRCLVSQEGGFINVLCSHRPRARYQVVFYRNNLLVNRNGNPDSPVFSARGKP